MYNILKDRICAGGFKLTEIQRKAKKLYTLGELDDEQLDELMELSQRNAAPEAERPETLEMLRALTARVEELEKKLATQENTGEKSNGYEAWTPWDGISNQYQPGSIVSHNGKLWKSVHTGQNTWEPGTVGTERLWAEYTEEE